MVGLLVWTLTLLVVVLLLLLLLLLVLMVKLHQMNLLLPAWVSHDGQSIRKTVTLVPKQVVLLRWAH